MKNYTELTLKEALEGLKKFDFTSRDLVDACYDHIEKHAGTIKPFITLIDRKDAYHKAMIADDIIASEGEKAFEEQPLLGIPYTCKDSFSTKGIQTTASSTILKGYVPPYESTVTKRLDDAGAILIAKDNMDAFAHGGSTETSDFHTTLNPWNLDKVPGGSSGGTGAAIASHFAIFGIGEDTGGSIRGPAAWCGITGLKTTYGRVSRYGVVAMASSTDSPGPMTKTAEDAAIVMNVIAGEDPNDATTAKGPAPDFTKGLDLDLSGLKIGKPISFFDKDNEPGVNEAVDSAISVLTEAGATVEEVELLDPKYALAIYTIVQRAEVSSNLARYDGIRFGHDRDAFGFEARKRMMLGAYALSVGYYDAYYSKAQKVRTLLIENFNKLFEKYDVLIGPSMPMIATDLGESDKSPLFGELVDRLNTPASMSGMPALSVPVGFVEDMPVGMQIMGKHLDDGKVLAVGNAFQKLTDHHKKFPNLENLKGSK